MWKNIPKKYIDEVYPDLIPLFKNRSDAHNGVSSSKKVDFICPCCNKIYNKRISDIVKAGHMTCPTCNDGFSYPEKFMSNLFNQLNIKYKYHVQENWTQGYIYDFIFEYDNQKYIIETDGGIGHGNKSFSDKSNAESLKIDNIKDEIAKNNGYIMIRIDCNYPDNKRYEYIKNSIITTLSFLIDLSKVDWIACHKKSLDSKFILVINEYSNTTKFLDELENITKIKQRTIYKYLSEAMNVGILPKEKILKTNPYKNLPSNINFINDGKFNGRTKLLYCFNSKTLFSSIAAAAEYYLLNESSLRQALIKTNGYYKGYHFIYYDNLPKDFNFENYKDNLNMTFKDKNIYQYDLKTKRLIFKYENVNQILEKYPNYLYSSIWRACTQKRKSAYGYIWSLTQLF